MPLLEGEKVERRGGGGEKVQLIKLHKAQQDKTN